MTILVTVVHILVALTLILVILLQAGKGADIGAAFGGASQTFFGGRGAATFLAKVTAGAAVLFMLTSLYLAHVSGRRTAGSLLDTVPAAPSAPSAPAAPSPAGGGAQSPAAAPGQPVVPAAPGQPVAPAQPPQPGQPAK